MADYELTRKVIAGELHKVPDTLPVTAARPLTPIQQELQEIYSQAPENDHHYSAQWVLFGLYDGFMGSRLGTKEMRNIYFDFVHLIRSQLVKPDTEDGPFWTQFIHDEQAMDVYCIQDGQPKDPSLEDVSNTTPKVFITATSGHAILVYVTYDQQGKEQWQVFDSNGAIDLLLSPFSRGGKFSKNDVSFVLSRNETQRFRQLRRLMDIRMIEKSNQEHFYPYIGAAPFYVVAKNGTSFLIVKELDKTAPYDEMFGFPVDPNKDDQVISILDSMYIRLVKQQGSSNKYRAYTFFSIFGLYTPYYPVGTNTYTAMKDAYQKYKENRQTEQPLDEVMIADELHQCYGTITLGSQKFWIYEMFSYGGDTFSYAVSYESYEEVETSARPQTPIAPVPDKKFRDRSRIQESGSCAYYAQYNYFRYRISQAAASASSSEKFVKQFDDALFRVQRAYFDSHRVRLEKQLIEYHILPYMLDLFDIVDYLRIPDADTKMLKIVDRDEAEGPSVSNRGLTNAPTTFGGTPRHTHAIVFPRTRDTSQRALEYMGKDNEFQDLTDLFVELFGNHMTSLDNVSESVRWAKERFKKLDQNQKTQGLILLFYELMVTVRGALKRLSPNVLATSKQITDQTLQSMPKFDTLFYFLKQLIWSDINMFVTYKLDWLVKWKALIDESVLHPQLEGLYLLRGRSHNHGAVVEYHVTYDKNIWGEIVGTPEFTMMSDAIQQIVRVLRPKEPPAQLMTISLPASLELLYVQAVEMSKAQSLTSGIYKVRNTYFAEFEKENALQLGVRKHPMIWPKFNNRVTVHSAAGAYEKFVVPTMPRAAPMYFLSSALEFATFDTNHMSTRGGYWVGTCLTSLNMDHPFALGSFIKQKEAYINSLTDLGFCNYLQLWLHILEPETYGAITPNWNGDSLASCTWTRAGASASASKTIPLNFDIALYPELLVVLADKYVRIDIYEEIRRHPHIRFYIALYPDSKLAILDRMFDVLNQFMEATRWYTQVSFLDKQGNGLVTTKLTETNLPPCRFDVEKRAIVSADGGHDVEVAIDNFIPTILTVRDAHPITTRTLSMSNGMRYFLQVRCAHNPNQFLAVYHDQTMNQWYFNDYRLVFGRERQRLKNHKYAKYWKNLPDSYLLESPDTHEIHGMLVINNWFNTTEHNYLYGSIEDSQAWPAKDIVAGVEYNYSVIFFNHHTVVNDVLHFQSFEECDLYIREVARGCRFDLFVRLLPQWRSWRNVSAHDFDMEYYTHGPFRQAISDAINIKTVTPRKLDLLTSKFEAQNWTCDKWGMHPVPYYLFVPFKYTDGLDEALGKDATFESCQQLFQYSFQHTVSDQQVQVCQEIISQDKKHYFIRQLVMGAGKSTVIIPLVSMYHAYKTNDPHTIQIVIAPTAVIVRQLITSLINGLAPYNRFVIHTVSSIKGFRPSAARRDLTVLVMTDMEAKEVFLSNDGKFPWRCSFTIIDEVDTIMNPFTSTFLLQNSKETIPVFTGGELPFFYKHMIGQFFQRFDAAAQQQQQQSDNELVRDIAREYFVQMSEGEVLDASLIIWSYALSAVMKMRYMYQYGFVEDNPIAIPYTGFEHPARKSRFTDPAIQLWSTLVGICHEGKFMPVQIKSLYEFCNRMRKINPQFEIPTEWDQTGVNPRKLPLTAQNLRLMTEHVLMPLVNQAHPVSQTNSVEMIHPRYGLVNTKAQGVHLKYAGVSGTIDHRLFPFQNDTAIHPDAATVQKISAVLDTPELYESVADLRQFLADAFTNPDFPYFAVMDVCGLATQFGETTTTIVETMHELAGVNGHNNRNVRVLYISVHDNELAYIYDGEAHQRFDGHLFPERYRYIYFFDQSHCVGVNIQQRYGDRMEHILPVTGVVLMERNDFAVYSKVAQAAFRLRHLLNGQNVFMVTVGGEGGMITSEELKAREDRLMDNVAIKIDEQIKRSNSSEARKSALPALWYNDFWGDMAVFEKYYNLAFNPSNDTVIHAEIATEQLIEEEEEEEEEEQQAQEQEEEQEQQIVKSRIERKFKVANVFGVIVEDTTPDEPTTTLQQMPYTMAFTTCDHAAVGTRLVISAQTMEENTDIQLNADVYPKANDRLAGSIDGLNDFLYYMTFKQGGTAEANAWAIPVFCASTLLYSMLYELEAYRFINVTHALYHFYGPQKFKKVMDDLEEVLSVYIRPSATKRALEDVMKGEFDSEHADLNLSEYIQKHLPKEVDILGLTRQQFSRMERRPMAFLNIAPRTYTYVRRQSPELVPEPQVEEQEPEKVAAAPVVVTGATVTPFSTANATTLNVPAAGLSGKVITPFTFASKPT